MKKSTTGSSNRTKIKNNKWDGIVTYVTGKEKPKESKLFQLLR